MVGVDFGNQEGNVFIHAERGSVADHRISGAREMFFRGPRDIRRQAGDHHIAIQRRLGRLHHHRFHEGGHVADQPPRTGFAIGLSLRTVRRRQRRHHKTRMVLQQLNETLADHSGCAQDSTLALDDLRHLIQDRSPHSES